MMTPVKHPSTDRFGILFVCTGNRCRSPFAEVLARRLLDEKFGPVHAARFDVSSAGTQAVPGASIHPLTRAELVGLGLAGDWLFPDSTLLSVDAIRSADLVLTAERAHRSIVVQLAPTALGKAFCVREFARLLASADCDGMPSEPVALARAAVVAARDSRGLIPPVVPSEDDIADPMGLNQAAHHAAARVISSALAQILGVPSLVAESRRRWSRPIRRRTASPEVPTDRESTLDPATAPSPAAPTVEHDPQPQPSDAVLPSEPLRRSNTIRSRRHRSVKTRPDS
jgi:protein-tyrosine phosphatase